MPKIRHLAGDTSHAMHNHLSQLINIDEQSFEMNERTFTTTAYTRRDIMGGCTINGRSAKIKN